MNTPKSAWTFLGLVVGGIVFLGFTLSVTVSANVMTLIAIWLFCMGAAGLSYMTTVKFHSPLCLTETENFTTFSSRTEVVYDKEWDANLGLVFVNGYNAAKRVLSKADIGTGGTTTLLVTSNPFMIETFANGRFIIVRGEPLQLNHWEARAFLNRPSVKAAIGDEVRSAVVYWVMQSKSLHADEMPKNVSTLGDLTATLQEWHGEIANSAEIFGEEFMRDLKAIRSFRESPLEKMAREKDWKPKEGEGEKNE